LAFKIIPIFHNTLLATTKIKFFLGLLPIFWGPPTNPPTTLFMGPNSNFTLGEFVLLGRLPNSNFTPGAFAHVGAHWGFLWFRGSKSNFTMGAFSFWRVSQTEILCVRARARVCVRVRVLEMYMAVLKMSNILFLILNILLFSGK
jgi:hypothetical protein